MYALELNDKPLQITPPFQLEKFKNVNILITNGYLNASNNPSKISLTNPDSGTGELCSSGKMTQYVSEERLKAKVEAAILEKQSQILIPCSSKNKVIALMLMLENMFKTNQRL
jgi:hypothetical protein